MPKPLSERRSAPVTWSSNPFICEYQPLKWQTEYNYGNAPSASPVATAISSQGSRPSAQASSRSASSLFPRIGSGGNLDTIPEDQFLERGTDFRFVGGVRNPVFEMSDLQNPFRSQNRRYSESDLLDRDYNQNGQRNEAPHFRRQQLDSDGNGDRDHLNRRRGLHDHDPRSDLRNDMRSDLRSDPRNDIRNSRTDLRPDSRTELRPDLRTDSRSDLRGDQRSDSRSDLRGETRSEVSVGGKSAKSGRSESVVSGKSDETKITSLTANSDRRQAGSRSGKERRPSSTPSRRSGESARSSSLISNNNNKPEPTAQTSSTIEIPIEFIETPATRIKKLFGPLIMCVLVITLAASLGAAIYFATVLKDAQQQTIEILRAQLEMSMSTSGVNVQTLSLRQRQNLTESYCKQVDLFYKESSLFQDTYKKCQVDSITNNKIKFTLFFEDEEDKATTDNIVDVLKGRATDRGKSMVQINQLKLDIASAKVTVEKVNDDEELTSTFATPPSPKSPTTSRTRKSTSSTSTSSPTVTPSTASVTQQPRSSTPDPCVGKTGDYIQHPRQCNLYIQCLNGESVLFTCPTGTVFNITLKVCTVKNDNMQCTADPWDPCKSNSEQQYYPYPEDCRLFFQCQHNKSIVRVCQNNHVFDSDQKICVPPSPDVKCPSPPVPSPQSVIAPVTHKTGDSHVTGTTNRPGTGSTTTPPPIIYPGRPEYSSTPCADGTNGGLYPDPSNCSRYILCEYKNERIMSCAKDLYFDPKIKVCIPAKNDLYCPDIRPCEGRDQGFFPHPRKCNKFIMCNDGKEVIQTCMHSLVWNPHVNSCVHKTNSVSCPDEDT
ncbi:uncharacterized protein LOC124281123 isoform X2 [Haliotis rubra]|uniref:uncharacterized protein LOC124281123 isoform X2 n=1 Tax=Haliotis rubra TaxID=36100 RepID=UPI001EE5DB1A|nr:uncharacterized protein LOC124281123 isoform X2 [Haliotis rubra]